MNGLFIKRPDVVPQIVSAEFAEDVVIIQERIARAKAAGHAPSRGGPPPYYSYDTGRFEYPPVLIEDIDAEQVEQAAVFRRNAEITARMYPGQWVPMTREEALSGKPFAIPDHADRLCGECGGTGDVQGDGTVHRCHLCCGAGVL
ncbi:MAG: hypothetical protein ACK4NW_02160 [Roseinatronobacter sp.]